MMTSDCEAMSRIRMAGRAVRGVMIGLLLVPACCGLVAIIGNISAFAYQGY